MATFAGRLKELRLNLGLLQKELSEKLNLNRSTLGSWESGNRVPELGTVQKLADYFDVSVDYLLGRENTNMLKEDSVKYVVGDFRKRDIDQKHKTFGERFKALREEMGLTLDQLAIELHSDTETLEHYEKNNLPEDDDIATLSKFFSVSPAFLMGYTEFEDEPPIITTNNPDEEVAQLLAGAGYEKLMMTKNVTIDELKMALALLDTVKKQNQ